MPVGVPDTGHAFLPRLRGCGFQPERADAGVVDLQIPPEQPADGVGDVAQRGVVELGRTFGEVLHQQVPYGPALDAVLVDDLLDAAPSFDPQCPEPRWCAGGQHTSLLEQRVEQRPACAASEMVLLQGGRQLDAVADSDVADQATLADHHPGELVHGVRPSPADRRAGLDLETAESVRVDGRPGLGKQERLALSQQPPVAGPDHLPGYQQDQPGAQLVAMMTPGRGPILQRQISPVEPGGVRSAGQPLLLPGLPGLALQPIQELGQATPPCLVPGAARGRVGEQAQQPLDQHLPALAGLPPTLREGPRFPLRRPASLCRLRHLCDHGAGGAVADSQVHRFSPLPAEVPNSTASTSGR